MLSQQEEIGVGDPVDLRLDDVGSVVRSSQGSRTLANVGGGEVEEHDGDDSPLTYLPTTFEGMMEAFGVNL